MEVAGLAVGVPPLLALTLDTYRQTYDAFRTFRHRHEEIRSLQRQLKIQERLFRTECSLLILWLIKDDDLTDRLLDDIRSQLWNEESILSLARRSLGESHDYYTDALDEVCGILNKVRKDLRSFDHKVSQNRGDIGSGSVSNPLRRLGPAFSILFQKSRYEKNIAALQVRNQEFRTIRHQLRELEDVHQLRKSAHEQRWSQIEDSIPTSIPTLFGEIRAASAAFHEALQTAWSCSEATHLKHYAILSTGSKKEEHEDIGNSRVDLSFSFEEAQIGAERSSQYQHASAAWLYVQSQPLSDNTPNNVQDSTVTKSLEDSCTQGHGHHHKYVKIDNGKTRGIMPDMAEIASETNKRRKKEKGQALRIISSQCTSPIKISKNMASNTRAVKPRDLRKAQDLCHELTRLPMTTNDCVGYLSSPNSFKHVVHSTRQKYSHLDESGSLEDILRPNIQDSVSIVGQLKLAHQIAEAVLKFHTTPWLPLEWRLNDFSVFGMAEPVSEDNLPKLLLKSLISKKSFKGNQRVPDQELNSIKQGPTQDEMKLHYGVNNLPLSSLGVALMEIGHWQTLDKLRASEESVPLVEARKLSYRNSPLGSKYQRIARKCLQCNFGCDTELESPELQNDVYKDVVCELDQMIKRMTI